MQRNARTLNALVGAAAALSFGPGLAPAADTPPLAGCYARTYDASHLAKHKDQLVTAVTLEVKAATPEMAKDGFVVDAVLKVRARGHKDSFDSLGACTVEGGKLACRGSLSAAEADVCKTKRDGIHECRVNFMEAGSFAVEARSGGTRVIVTQQLEMVSAPYDGGPFLYIGRDRVNGTYDLAKVTCG